MSATLASKAPSHPTDCLRSLGYTGQVRLRGRWGQLLRESADFYGALSVDSVLHGFRVRAGLPAPGSPMGGWASETSEMTFGQWVSGLSRASAVLGEPRLAERSADLLDGYALTLSPSRETGMTVYAWEKLICGLVDAGRYAGYRQATDLLPSLVDARPEVVGKQDATARYFMGSPSPSSTEWYTLPENLIRASQLLQSPDLLSVAREFYYPTYWSKFRQVPRDGRKWGVPAYLHAYSHVNTFASLAAAYEVEQDPDLLTMLRHAYEWVTTTQCFATGGYGPREFTVAEDGTLGRSLEWTSDSSEIVCGSWAAFKLSSALLTFTGEARYADWAELLIYNGIGSCLAPRLDGLSPYYDNYRMGDGAKLPYPEAWPCCSGSYAQAVPHIADLVYFSDADGIYVATYLPSQLHVKEPFAGVVTIDTGFPSGIDATITVAPDHGPAQFAMNLRLPYWSSATQVRVNGEPVGNRATPQGWLRLERSWLTGDVIQIQFAPSLELKPVDPAHPRRAAVMYGPVVLAQEVMDAWPFAIADPVEYIDLADHLERVEDELVFSPVGPGTPRMRPGLFRPLFAYPERRPYRVYHDLDQRRLI